MKTKSSRNVQGQILSLSLINLMMKPNRTKLLIQIWTSRIHRTPSSGSRVVQFALKPSQTNLTKSSHYLIFTQTKISTQRASMSKMSNNKTSKTSILETNHYTPLILPLHTKTMILTFKTKASRKWKKD